MKKTLDVGCSRLLQRIARAKGNEEACVRWLTSELVQGFLVALSKEMLFNSLDAERGAAKAKHVVSRKVPNNPFLLLLLLPPLPSSSASSSSSPLLFVIRHLLPLFRLRNSGWETI